MDAVALVAIALLAGGIVGTLLPLVPGGLLTLSGLFVYWWHSGFTEPGTLALFVLAVLGACTLLAELFGASLSARVGGASWTTTAIATVVAIALLFVAGPLGLLVGLFATVFVLEFVQEGDVQGSSRAAVYATVGVLASTAIQVLLTTTAFVGFVVVVFVL